MNIRFPSSLFTHPESGIELELELVAYTQKYLVPCGYLRCLHRLGMYDIRSTGNPCSSGVAVGSQLRFLWASQMMLNTCVKAMEWSFLDEVGRVTCRY